MVHPNSKRVCEVNGRNRIWQEKVPILTFALMFGMVVFYYAWNTPAVCCTTSWLTATPDARLFEWLIHPLIHENPAHLYGNLIIFAVVGVLLESWVPITNWWTRGLIFLISYVISLGLSGFALIMTGLPAIGSSVMVYAILAFDLYFYVYRTPKLTRMGLIAPILMGVAFGPLVVALMTDALVSRTFAYDQPSGFHVLGLILGFLAVVLLIAPSEPPLRNSKRRTKLHRMQPSTPASTPKSSYPEQDSKIALPQEPQ